MTDAVSPKQIVSLLKALDQTKTKVADIKSPLAERIKLATTNDNVNAKALRRIVEEINMNEDKHADYLRSLNHYRIIAEEAGLFGEPYAGDMVEMAKEAEWEEDADHGKEVEPFRLDQAGRIIKQFKVPEDHGGKGGGDSYKDAAE